MSITLDDEQTQHIFLTLVESLEDGERLPTKILVTYLQHPEDAIRKLAVELIEYGNDPAAIPALLRAAADSNIEVSLSASEVLRSFRNPAAVRTYYIATLSGGVTGAGNALVVPKDSPIQSVAQLKGKNISVPFGSTAHAFLLFADKVWYVRSGGDIAAFLEQSRAEKWAQNNNGKLLTYAEARKFVGGERVAQAR